MTIEERADYLAGLCLGKIDYGNSPDLAGLRQSILVSLRMVKQETLQEASNIAIEWSIGKEQGDYDTYSASSAISILLWNKSTEV